MKKYYAILNKNNGRVVSLLNFKQHYADSLNYQNTGYTFFATKKHLLFSLNKSLKYMDNEKKVKAKELLSKCHIVKIEEKITEESSILFNLDLLK